MNSMAFSECRPGLRPAQLESCQWAAVRNLRRLAQEQNSCLGSGSDVLPPGAEMAWAKNAYRVFLAAAQQAPGLRAPRLARLDSPELTKDERRLLRALAAAQENDQPVLDNYLYKFALDRQHRVGLADAVRALAAALAIAGFRLPTMAIPCSPAPALRVAFVVKLLQAGEAVA